MTIHLIQHECLTKSWTAQWLFHQKEKAKSKTLLNLPGLADVLAIWSSISLSTSGLISWTILTDSERRLSKFTSAITSLRCSWSWKKTIFQIIKMLMFKTMHIHIKKLTVWSPSLSWFPTEKNIFNAVPRPWTWSFPQSRHFSQPTQSISALQTHT